MLQTKTPEAASLAPSASYHLECLECRASFADDGVVLRCPECDAAGLLQALYEEPVLRIDEEQRGLFRYRSCLPIARTLPATGATITFRSEQMSRRTGLANLWIAFNGFWPERDGSLRSGSFKELEAMCVLARHPVHPASTLVLASAGNTANAFARASSRFWQRCLIVVPEAALAYLHFEEELAPCVSIVVITGGDYSDAIALAESIGRQPGFVREGGVRNVARRAGLGSVVFNAFEAMGTIPEVYFQAIGSGAGAIGVAEAARRMPTGASRTPCMWLSQNLPFTPVADAWSAGAQQLPAADAQQQRRAIQAMSAPVLANRNPPYALRGGLYDLLTATEGQVASITNEEAAEAGALFEEDHGIDVDSAASVALAHLLNSCRRNLLRKDATILLNVTGGGRKRLAQEFYSRPHPGHVRVSLEEAQWDTTVERICAWIS